MRWLAVLILIIVLLSPTLPASSAQDAPVITDLGVSYRFGEQITFKVRVEPPEAIDVLSIYLTPQGQAPFHQNIPFSQANTLGELNVQVRTDQLGLSPFSNVSYRYGVTLKNGETVSSETKTFVYEDNRFNWKQYQNGIYQVYWVDNDPALGQQIADIAEQGMQKAQAILPEQPSNPLRIYAYASARDLQSALRLTNQPWVAGHTNPELGMVVISVPSGPERKLELERQIPHEIMHILQYQAMGKSYTQQPVWLVEGMASLVELYPNPEYSRVLESAARSQQIIPFRDLCSSFPHEAGAAFQSYAQSESFVRFLMQKYGASGLQKLIAAYRNGLGCEEGFTSALGASTSQLEYRWQQETLGVNPGGLALSKLAPYLLVGLFVLLPAVLAFLPIKRFSEGKPARRAG